MTWQAELTDVDVVQWLIQGQHSAVLRHGGDQSFLSLRRVVAAGRDDDLVLNLPHTHKQITPVVA